VEQDGKPPDREWSAQPPVPPPGYRTVYPEESQAVLALVLSVVGLVVCGGVLCPVGWYLAHKEIAAIDSGRRDPSKRDTAQAGKIVGIIGTVLVAVGILIIIGLVVLAIAFGAAAST